MDLQYKIWDIPNKKWVEPPYCINQFGDLQVKDVIFQNMSDFKICVFTGLRDNKRTKEFPNGQAIYEGDIIPYHFNEKILGIIKYGEYKNICDDVHGGNVGFYVYFIDEFHRNITRKDLAYWAKISHVIGNVYENSDLLEVSK